MIELGKDEKALLVAKIQRYFEQELQQRIGGFDAQFLLDFFAREAGAHFYNRGLHDAQALIALRLEDLADAIYQLERPTQG
ncbi:DUF2164 domain-containing protein [Stenotrophomonas sp. MMGLT7]|uniref:DUF2164 domain-containing protein n=1 Tax=Stenotrophomonas sp. MMGLT7 TaxID=2901227 RepID=UPI001E3A609D|nr:DUF2164 domain-containing protein [Stenotrophomonas sp. MMGLT7]MCD7099882.1 DUF2164 domain-containing protein [Stenotrophomonas sp. MMGLT7]